MIGLLGITIALGILIGLFFVCRGIINWYFRTNEIVTLLKQIEKNTRKETKEQENGNKN